MEKEKFADVVAFPEVKKKRTWTASSPFQAFWWWGRLVAGYSQTFTVFILASKWFRFTPPSFTSLNPLETFFRSLQPHSSSHNWGKYENSRFNSDASGYIELENAVTRSKPCTRNQVASEWVKKIFIRSWVELHFPIISYILSFNYSYRYEINLIRIMYAANSSILYSKEKTGRILGTWHQYLVNVSGLRYSKQIEFQN